MRKIEVVLIEWLLRISLSVGFLSAVADRLGLWRENVVWGNWQNFVRYTQHITSFLPVSDTSLWAYLATFAEIFLGVLLWIPFKTKWIAMLSGMLLLSFAISMTLTSGIKVPLDYSVYSAAAAAFALSYITPYKK